MIYAFGDIHGRLDLLTQAVEQAYDFARIVGDTDVQLVFLGDYVDRGPDSKGVVEKLIELSDDGAICLRGNHEQMMIDAASGNLGNRHMWISNGGGATLAAYGEDTETLSAHVDWMDTLPTHYETDTHIFVHAGLNPRAPDSRIREHLLWIRESFLMSTRDWGKHVVHGHTPVWGRKKDPTQPELLPNRTNLDTGAFHTGVLSVGVFSPEQAEPIAVLSTEP